MTATRTTTAYKGYLITHNPIQGMYYVTKDGVNIASATTLDGAQAAIDTIA